MTHHNPALGTDTGLSATRRKPKGILTPTEWAEVFDALTIALDALGDRPEQVDHARFLNCVANQRIALRVTHKRLQATEEVTP